MISIKVTGLAELRKDLDKAQGKQLRATSQRATAAGGKTLKPRMKRAAPVGKTHRLQKAVSSRQAKRDRPATVVGPRAKVAPHAHLVIDGTRAHRIRFPDQVRAGVPKSMGNIRHPGAKANPFPERAAAAGEREAVAAATKVLDKELP